MQKNLNNNLIQNILTIIIGYLLPVFITSNFITIINNKKRLKRISKYAGCLIKDGLDNKNYDISKLKQKINQEKVKKILPYVEKLSEYTSEENLKNIYLNLNTLKIKRNPFIIIYGINAGYSILKNEITYFDKNSIGHEFLHFSSSFYDNESGVVYGGFQQSKGMASIGQGLDEGYTELLASRIYNKNHKVGAYKSEVKIARLLEFFFSDKKEMEKYYFNHNLPGFIHYLEQFSSRDEVINLILAIDLVHHTSRKGSVLPIYNSLKIQLKLYNWLISKCHNSEKIKEFEKIISENKFIWLILNNQKMKLVRKSPYEKKGIKSK